MLVLMLAFGAARAKDIRYVVSPDGTGDFTTVNAAVSAVPADAQGRATVFVKNGDYHEKVFVTAPNLTLVGEDREKVVIHFAILNEEWERAFRESGAQGSSRWGCAVVNIAATATDFTLANLTVYNNYGTTVRETHNHQFAVFGRATRTITRNCNLWSDGSDTVSLWANDGMYYHENCDIRSHGVDFLCPRGWCFAKNCTLTGRGPAEIWHDGRGAEDMKFVLVNCRFESGKPKSELGRHHGEAAFYLKDCVFGENVTRPISPARSDTLRWGERVYYSNCRTAAGATLEWAKDNFPMSPDLATAEWTFAGRWNPEGSLQITKAE